MKERPILMRGEMVRAILDGRKTQTRRPVKLPPALIRQGADLSAPSTFRDPGMGDGEYLHVAINDSSVQRVRCPCGDVGDRLWVRETWGVMSDQYVNHEGEPTWWRATDDLGEGYVRPHRWRSAIHMPRWRSRITLEITQIRVQRLQEISEADCWAEGIEAVDGLFDEQIFEMARRIGCTFEDAKPTFACLWESINGKESWDANPWVFACTFKRI